MKILKIRFENIHSLKGEHEIDFENGALADAGLFAITGPTGSGKSTLLDVITLALYNRIARVDKSITRGVLEDDGGIMTRNMRNCYAEVEYRVNGKEYRSHWSIERNRNNNLNSRKQELVDTRTGNILESGTKTPEKNQEIIGLSYEQFVKAMVLAQGEFSKLLQAPRNERNKLLEDITGARSYRDIGAAVYRRFSGIQQNIKLKEAGLENIELLSPEAIQERKEEINTLNESKSKIENAFKVASDSIQVRQNLLEKEKEKEALEVEQKKYQEDFKVYQPYELQLNLHDKLSVYSDSIREYDTTLKSISESETQLKQLKENKSEEVTHQKAVLDTISKLLKEEIQIDAAHTKLESFRKQITNLQAEEKAKQGEARLHQNQLDSYIRNINTLGHAVPFANTPKQTEQSLDILKVSMDEALQKIGVTSASELEDKLIKLRKSDEQAKDLITKKEQQLKVIKQLEEQKTKLDSEENAHKKDTEKAGTLKVEIEKLSQEVTVLGKELELQRKHQSLDQHREQLQEGEPCPLCGSLDHPYSQHAPVFDAKEELLKEKKEVLKTKSDFQISLDEKSKYRNKEIQNLKTQIENLNIENSTIQNKINAICALILWNSNDSLEKYLEQRKQLLESFQKLEQSKKDFQVQSLLRDAFESLKHWNRTLTEYSEKHETRKSLYQGEDINEKAHQLATNLTKSITQINALSTQLKDLETKSEVLNREKSERSKIMDAILLKENLESLEVLKKGILKEDIANRIRKQQRTLNETKTRLSEKEKALTKILNELQGKDDKESTLENLTLRFEESKKQREELFVNLGKLQQSLTEDENARKRQKKVLDELELLRKDLALWKTMNDLIGDSNGNKFSNFVQDLTLEQLIGFTNQRLSEFSDRYLLDIPTPEEADKSDTLKVFDSYMGNARRSVRTLSGGETFLVSLAMAFALSDIAARNVKIESLFIDEGFGTLDPETLDQAITILEKMQHEGDRSVGIISHVGALKERITTQIQLEKGSLGYSTVQIVQ